MMEYRETFLLLLKHFDETRQSRYVSEWLVNSYTYMAVQSIDSLMGLEFTIMLTRMISLTLL